METSASSWIWKFESYMVFVPERGDETELLRQPLVEDPPKIKLIFWFYLLHIKSSIWVNFYNSTDKHLKNSYDVINLFQRRTETTLRINWRVIIPFRTFGICWTCFFVLLISVIRGGGWIFLHLQGRHDKVGGGVDPVRGLHLVWPSHPGHQQQMFSVTLSTLKTVKYGRLEGISKWSKYQSYSEISQMLWILWIEIIYNCSISPWK